MIRVSIGKFSVLNYELEIFEDFGYYLTKEKLEVAHLRTCLGVKKEFFKKHFPKLYFYMLLKQKFEGKFQFYPEDFYSLGEGLHFPSILFPLFYLEMEGEEIFFKTTSNSSPSFSLKELEAGLKFCERIERHLRERHFGRKNERRKKL